MRLIKTFALSYLYAQIAGADEDRNAIQSMDDLITAEDLKLADKLDSKDNDDELALNAEMNAKNPNLLESMEFPEEVTKLWSEVKAERKKPAGWEGIVYDSQGNEVQESLNVQRTTTPHIYGVDCGVLGSGSTRIANQWSEGIMENAPWTVYIFIGTLNDNGSAGTPISCQGSIISNEWILTGASCFHNVNVDYIRVISGRKSIDPDKIHFTAYVSAEFGDIPADTAVTEYFPHPDFEYLSDESTEEAQQADEKNKRNRNNIALLKTVSSLGNLNAVSRQGAVCLPSSDMCMNELDNIELDISGWGFTKEDGKMIKKLRYGRMHLKQWGDCSHFFSTNKEISNHWSNQFLSEKEMCAGGKPGDSDMCYGDEGGPLTFFDDDTVGTQVGIGSLGFGCGRDNYPRMFTRVSDYLQYIKDVSGIYMVGDPNEVNNYETGHPCYENGANLDNVVRDDASNFGFAVYSQGEVSARVTEDLPHDKNFRIWSWNNPEACLAKKLRRRSLNDRNGKFLSLVQRCDQVRDNVEGRKRWGAHFEFEYLPETGEIVQRGFDLYNSTTSLEDEFCVMLTKKSVNLAACETNAFSRPRKLSTFDYLSQTGAILTKKRWENDVKLNYKYRVLFYPTYMTFWGKGRKGEISMKHGVFKFSAFGWYDDSNDSYRFSDQENQLKLQFEQSSKLMGDDVNHYCAKIYHHGLQRDWNNGYGMAENRQVQMVPCENSEDSYGKGSWVLEGGPGTDQGLIKYKHHISGDHSNGRQFCMMSTGKGTPVWIRTCDPSNYNSHDYKYKWFYNYQVSQEQRTDESSASYYQGITDYTIYHGSDHLNSGTSQCMYVNQKNYRLYVATCTDMNWSFGVTRNTDYYQ